MTIKIEDVFSADHERIKNLIEKKDIKKLKDQLATHFRKENIMYDKFHYETHEILPILQRIQQEHKEIMELIDSDPEAAIQLLIRHRNVEERTFYPKLDEALSEWDKEEAYREIMEIRK
jgi:hypothetical protein